MAIPIRFWIAVMIFFTTYVTFAIRVNMSVNIIAMVGGKDTKTPECLMDKNHTVTEAQLPDYGPRYDWSTFLQGQILAIYFAGYVLLSLPSGVIVESLGPYRTLLMVNSIQITANILCVVGAWYHYSFLMAARFVIGASGGLEYPALQSMIARWAPPEEKGKFVSALMGSVLGTCVTWPLTGQLTQSFGWDWGFYHVSIECFLFTIVFFFVASDGPDDHPWITEEEKNFIQKAQGGGFKKQGAPPYKEIFRCLPFWALIVLHFGNLWGLYLQSSGVPKFLAEVIGFNIKKSGALAALPSLSRLICGLVFGALGDHLKKRDVSVNFIRKFFVLISHVLPGISMIMIVFMGCNWVPIVGLFIFSLASNGAAVLTNLINSQDLSPNFAGGLYGIMSFFGGMSGYATPAVIGLTTSETDGFKQWGYNFIIGGVIYISTGIFFIFFGSVELQSWNEKKEEG